MENKIVFIRHIHDTYELRKAGFNKATRKKSNIPFYLPLSVIHSHFSQLENRSPIKKLAARPPERVGNGLLDIDSLTLLQGEKEHKFYKRYEN